MLLGGAAFAQNAAPPPPFTLERRAVFYVQSTVGPGTLLKDLVVSGIAQWADIPPDRGQGWDAFGRRYGYRVLSDGASNVIRFGLSAAFHEDTRYLQSPKRGVKNRIRYLLTHTYWVRSDNGPGMKFSWSRLAGGYAGAWAANGWAPQRLRTPGDVLIRGTLAIPGEFANSAFQEFWPDLTRLLKRKVFHRQ